MAGEGDDSSLQEFMDVFADEADERLLALNRNLVSLEETPAGADRDRLLADAFREAHSLKGAAGMVGMGDVAAAAHQLESLFGQMQRREVDPDPQAIDEVYRALDALSAMIGASVGQRGMAGPAPRPSGPVSAPVSPQPGPEPAPVLAQPARAPARTPGADAQAMPDAMPAGRSSESTVRVSTAKLDSLMAHLGQLTVARIGAEHRVAQVGQVSDELAGGRLAEAIRRLVELRRELEADGRRMAQVAAELEEDVRRTRMVPVSTLLEAFPRLVRDLARGRGKEVRLVVRGEQTEVDRSVAEHLRAALTHLLRNCVDHGVEDPETRKARGKSTKGTITLTASQDGGLLRIEVTDDGEGIDLGAVRRTSVERGLLTEDAARALSDRESVSLLFRSGLSTRSTVTEVSGRGIGLDAVRADVEQLHGTIDVATERGSYTTFTLSLPLSVSTTRCVLIEAGGQKFGIPTTGVVQLTRAAPEEMGHAQGRRVVVLEDGPVTLDSLAGRLGLEPPGHSNGDAATSPEVAASPRDRERKPIVVLGSSDRRIGFVVDTLVGAQELVLQSLPAPLYRVRHLAGASILSTGKVITILNPGDLIRSAEQAPATHTQKSEARGEDRTPTTVLIADDSFTTRTLEKNILESAGYRVLAAADGLDAWAILQRETCDLVVSDIQMPTMDGFELTTKIRADERFQSLPVVLVTTLDSDSARRRGVEAGADAYIVKSAFEQVRLLDTIRRLI
jgi:two-component system, chemotaxis family, sensor kinase CheA